MGEYKAHILLVDDESFSIWMIQDGLELRGYQVSVAGDEQTALSLVAKEKPDLIILGNCPPGLDGYEICRSIRDFSSVPIIMLAIPTGMADRVKGFRLGADDYVTKPFMINELAARVKALLRRVEFSKQNTCHSFAPPDLTTEPVLTSTPAGDQPAPLLSNIAYPMTQTQMKEKRLS